MKLAGRTGLTRHRSLSIWVPKLSASSRPGLAASALPPKPRRPADGASRGGNGSSNVGSGAVVPQPARPQGREEPDAIAFLNTTLFLIGLILVEYGVWDLLDEVLGDSVWGSVFCIVWGLGIIIYIRISGLTISDIFSLR